MNLNSVILSPIITEKSLSDKVNNKYHFKVNYKASKKAIADSISALFGVTVVDIKTMVMPGKKRRVFKRRYFTTTPKWKKAIVKLEEGQEIKLVEEGTK